MEHRGLESEIRAILDRQAALAGNENASLARQELEFEKWRLIHKQVHQHPFTLPARLARAAQWRETANRIRDLGEIELLDWTLQQAEIAHNLERGIQDMRPRKDGPCHVLVLEYVANRKRKALAVLRFAKAGEEDGLYKVNSAFHAQTRDILGGDAAEKGSGGHEGVPWAEPDEEA
ncbi:MAG: hypothetical protein ACTSQ7_06505 [Alphaproteobacteria bacterium]